MSARYLNTLESGAGWRGTPARAGTPTGVGALAARTLGTLRLWLRRSRQRASLRGVLTHDARFFLDIGVPRATVFAEAGKWFWQA